MSAFSLFSIESDYSSPEMANGERFEHLLRRAEG